MAPDARRGERVIIIGEGEGPSFGYSYEQAHELQQQLQKERSILLEERARLLAESQLLSEEQRELIIARALEQADLAGELAKLSENLGGLSALEQAELARGLADSHRAWADEQANIAWSAHWPGAHEEGPSAVERALLSLNLISDYKNYKMELTTESLRINGRKQSSENHQYIKSVYESQQGCSMGSKSRVSVNKRSN